MPENNEVMSDILDLQRKDAADATSAPSPSESKHQLDMLSAALNKIEAQQLSGAASLTPKEVMLDLSELKAKHPDKHFRWVNIKAPGNADLRRMNGYIRVPESEGGRQLGDELAVFVCTEANKDRQIAEHKRLNALRLDAHKAEVERTAEAVAKELRDKHGIKVNAERIFISE